MRRHVSSCPYGHLHYEQTVWPSTRRAAPASSTERDRLLLMELLPVAATLVTRVDRRTCDTLQDPGAGTPYAARGGRTGAGRRNRLPRRCPWPDPAGQGH